MMSDVVARTTAASGVSFRPVRVALLSGASAASGFSVRLWMAPEAGDPTAGDPSDPATYDGVLVPMRALLPLQIDVARLTTDEQHPDFHKMVTRPVYEVDEEEPRELRRPDEVELRWAFGTLEARPVRDADGQTWMLIGDAEEAEGFTKATRTGRRANQRSRSRLLNSRADPAVATAALSAMETRLGLGGGCAVAAKKLAQPVGEGGVALADVRRTVMAAKPEGAVLSAMCREGCCKRPFCLWLHRARGAVLEASLARQVDEAVAAVGPSTLRNSQRKTVNLSSPGAGTPVPAESTGSGKRRLSSRFEAAASSAPSASTLPADDGTAPAAVRGLAVPVGARALASSRRSANGAPPPARQPPTLAPARGSSGRGGGDGDSPLPPTERTVPGTGTSRSLPPLAPLAEGGDGEGMRCDPEPVQGWTTPYSAVLNTPAVDARFQPLVSALVQAFGGNALALGVVYTYDTLSTMVTPPLAQQLDELMSFLETHGHVTSGGGDGGDETITFYTQPIAVVTSL